MKQAYMPQAKSDHYVTPDRVYDESKALGYDIKNAFDPCPLNSPFDGLTIIWQSRNYINPPYTKLEEFVKKAFYEWLVFKHESILLLPVKTDQDWFHKFCKGFEIYFFKKRLKFKNAKHHATQPHMLVLMVNND